MKRTRFNHWIMPLLLATLLVPAMSMAGVYRWIDENGKTHYSDKPVNVDEAEGLAIKSEPTDTTAVAAETQAAQAEVSAGTAEATPEETQAQIAKRLAEETEVIRQKNCDKANKNYKKLLSPGRLFVTGEDGEKRYIGEEEIDERRAKAMAVVQDWCTE